MNRSRNLMVLPKRPNVLSGEHGKIGLLQRCYLVSMW